MPGATEVVMNWMSGVMSIRGRSPLVNRTSLGLTVLPGLAAWARSRRWVEHRRRRVRHAGFGEPDV